MVAKTHNKPIRVFFKSVQIESIAIGVCFSVRRLVILCALSSPLVGFCSVSRLWPWCYAVLSVAGVGVIYNLQHMPRWALSCSRFASASDFNFLSLSFVCLLSVCGSFGCISGPFYFYL